MARPLQDGVNYWPYDVGLMRDTKVRLLKGEFGILGVYVYIHLLSSIYEENGYYKKWSDDVCILVSDEVGCGCNFKTINEIVKGCVRRSLFDERVLDVFGVLTSAGIQRRYIRAALKREDIHIIKEYWLLDNEDSKDVPASILNKLTFKTIFGTGNPVNSTGNPDKTTENPQSKVKESKGKKSKGRNTLSAEPTVYEQIVGYLNYVMGTTDFKPTSKATQKHINGRLAEGYTVEDFKTVIDKKYLEWSQRPDMIQFMRPETLFCPTHFESYLNQAWTDGRKESTTEAALRRFTAEEQVIDSSYEVIVQDGEEEDIF